MNETIFLVCQCGMLVGCFAEGRSNLFCDECEPSKALSCTITLDESEDAQTELFAETCEYCQVVIVNNPKESPAFLSS